MKSAQEKVHPSETAKSDRAGRRAAFWTLVVGAVLAVIAIASPSLSDGKEPSVEESQALSVSSSEVLISALFVAMVAGLLYLAFYLWFRRQDRTRRQSENAVGAE